MVSRKRALAFCFLPLFGCAHLQKEGANEELDHTVELYWKAVSWQDPVAGSAFVDFDSRADWLRTRDKKEKDLTVTSWDVQGSRVEPDTLAATILVKVSWFLLPSTIEESDIVEQRWIKKSGHWLVISEKGGPLPFP